MRPLHVFDLIEWMVDGYFFVVLCWVGVGWRELYDMTVTLDLRELDGSRSMGEKWVFLLVVYTISRYHVLRTNK